MGVSLLVAAFDVVATETWVMVAGFAINMVASMIISKIFAPDSPNSSGSNNQPNPGSNAQQAPAGDNKLPVIYGSYYTGGIVTDLTISVDNQNLYWVISLSEVTNSEDGNTPDVFTFGKIYWGGKLVVFSTTVGQLYKVTGLKDESTGLVQDVTGYMDIYLYSNGSNNPANSAINAYVVMQASSLIYKWDTNKLMSNCAFAIVHIQYSQSRNLVGLSQTRFQINNPRNSAGDCLTDYLTSTRYGAAIDIANIDTASMTALNTYSNALFTYTLYNGGSATQPRFKFNGSLDTNTKIMTNIQNMADSCDCLIRYSEITSLWGAIVQTPTYTVAMDINDSNMVSALSVTPIDLSNSFNVIEVKFPDGSSQSNFASAAYDLSVINPSLMFPNEPVNKQSVSLFLCDNSVQAQYLANRFLEAAREDLQLTVDIDYTGLQLDAGDIVTVTNDNYGWVAKLFRIAKVTQKFSDSGQVSAGLNLMEYNPTVYDDKNVTQFTPSPNTGISSPIIFGIVPAPTISNALPYASNPAFNVNITTSSAGIIQYAEVWYSAYQFPTSAQMIFAGTTAINPNGDPYTINFIMPAVQLFNIPAGNWYFFSRMVNNLASSNYSLASDVLNWRPTTFQFSNRWLSVVYADDQIGTGISLSPVGKLYYGLAEQSNTTTPNAVSLVASNYKFYFADPAFSTNKYLVYQNYSNRKFGFDTDFGTYAGGSGIFVPTDTAQFDIRLWSALDPLGTYPNCIDLDAATGQTIKTGYATGDKSTGTIPITNTGDGRLTAALDVFLPQIPTGTYLTGSAATITVDRFGRVVGFVTPDSFFFSVQYFTATSGQTLFTPTARVSGYILGQDLIFKNGLLLETSEYTETLTTFTLSVGATLNDIITVISMRAVSSALYYEPLSLVVQSTATNTAIWTTSQMPFQDIDIGNILTFTTSGTPTQYTVTGVNYTTRTITFSTTVTGVSAGAFIYRYRAASSSYKCFTRYAFSLTSASTYTPTDWAFNSGFEIPFLNGTIVNGNDYDIVGNSITNFPTLTTGSISVIQFESNNLNQPIGTMANVIIYTSTGVSSYNFNFNANAFDLFLNGCLCKPVTDYTTSTNNYTLTTTPDNSITVLQQQTFSSAGAA